ncbi:MAG: hypothetical protein AAB373_03405 [Patescibacteria group bacterium]
MPINKICKVCDKAFAWEDADLEYFKRFGFEPLDTCRDCLHMQRLCFRNERVFYRRKCDATGQEIISLYHPDSLYEVYKADYYWSDKWDPMSYGRSFDFARSFFEQFQELKMQVPRLAIHNAKAENSDYCNTSVGNKNSYMIFGGDYNENGMFGVLCDKNRFCVDLDFSYNNELLYFCSDVVNSYDCQFLFNSDNCANCYFCEECSGCSECILCFNLKNQKFCIENKQYSKEEYFEMQAKLINGSKETQRNLFSKFVVNRKNKITKYAHVVNCQDCSGDYLKNSKNCKLCFDVANSEDCRDVIYGSKVKDCFLSDMLGLGQELAYNMVSALGGFNNRLSFWLIDSNNITYCDFMNHCSDCLGCIGLNHRSYCILNKQYSKEEYEELMPKIVDSIKKNQEWGEFFDPKLSCFGYNETTANIYFPLKKEEALARGFKWQDKTDHTYKQQTYRLADNINDVSDDILDAILQCETCSKNYKILKEELAWYRKKSVPIPTECFDCRMKMRADLRNPKKLWERQCDKCGSKLESTYDPAKEQKVYCEKCYLAEVY